MFRAIVKQRSNLDLLPIADMQILNASISEDTTQKATSTINVVEVPSNVFLGDLVGVYTSKGVFIYWGTISAINENKITLQQFNSFYNDTHLLVPQTSNNQKTFFNTKTISNVIELYLKSKELGHQSTLNDMSASLVPTYQGLVDKDVANNYKGITHTIIDNEQTFAPYPQEKESKNLETFLYDMFNTYNRIIKPVINLKGGGGTPQKDYYELEYIQSDGNQYIQTNISPSLIGREKCKVNYQATSRQCLLGSWQNGNILNYQIGYIDSNRFNQINITGVEKENINTISVVANTDYEMDMNFIGGNYIINDTICCTINGFATGTRPLWIFCSNDEVDGAYIKAKCKLHYLEIYDKSGIIAYNFVPALRKSDMAIGLWDKVNNEFYGNAGTGQFIGGGIVE